MSKFCSNCGAELKENADICLSCGTFISKSNVSRNNRISDNTKTKSSLLAFIASIFASVGLMLLLWSFAWMYVSSSGYVYPGYEFATTSLLFFIVSSILQIISMIFASIDYKNNVIERKELFFQISFTVFNLSMFLVSSAAII